MAIRDVYNNIPHDNSGSIAKNRFGYELAFGLDKMIENYNKYSDFSIIFDYVCDIELHCDNEDVLEFYQVKTSKNPNPFDTSFITNKGKKTNSIVGTLYKLTLDSDVNKISKSVIVGNVPFKDKDSTIYEQNKLYPFAMMAEKTKSTILNQLQDEGVLLDGEDLSSLYFLYHPVTLDTYDDTMLGRLTKFYEENIDEKIIKPRTLYSVIKDKIIEKASYEGKDLEYDEVVAKKGLSKSEFTKILKYHSEKGTDLIGKCIDTYKEFTSNVSEITKMKTALTNIVKNDDVEMTKTLEKIENVIYEEAKDYDGNLNDFITYFVEKYDNFFPITCDLAEKYAFVLYVYIKVVEN